MMLALSVCFFVTVGCDDDVPERKQEPAADTALQDAAGDAGRDLGSRHDQGITPPTDVGSGDLADDSAPPVDMQDTSLPPDASSPASDFVVHIPSSAGGTEGIAVRVVAPASPGRYAEGAPIVIGVQGGWSNGSGGPVDESFVTAGLVSIGWVFPGGSSQTGTSGGTFDVRGPNCVRALADVTLYAMGLLADDEGRMLTDRVPHALVDEVGMIGLSNGGNLALAALGVHGTEISAVSWLVAWESPIGDQQSNVELNGNPHYTPGNCDAMTCAWSADFATQLAWDANRTTSARHDRMETVSGRLTVSGGPPNLLQSLPSGFDAAGVLRLYPSQELATALRSVESSLFGAAGAPEWMVLDATASESYWSTRDAALQIAAVAMSSPHLLVMHLQRVSDHVQTQPDYPHATAHMLGWSDAGHAFFRLNPDAAYQEYVQGGAMNVYRENDARVVVQYPGAESQMIPNAMAGRIQLAGVLELADRTHVGDRTDDLSAVLVDVEAPGAPGVIPCDEMRTMRCCGDGVCGGPETAQNCPEDC
jgi:hypothetical protein